MFNWSAMRLKEILFILSFLFVTTVFGQGGQRFVIEQLNDPQIFGSAIAGSMSAKEIYEFKKTEPSAIFLQNGLRASSFMNQDEWIKIKDTVEVTSVDIVYSKYPLREGQYHEIYPLLFDRLKALFKLDPELNDSSIIFTKVLQTHCEDDVQVKSLFHGIVIHYTTNSYEVPIKEEKVQTVTAKVTQQHEDQFSFEEMEATVENLLESPFITDSIKELIRFRPMDEQTAILKEFLIEEINNEQDHDLSTASPEELKLFESQIGFFMSSYSASEPVIERVFSRHPEWKNILVVNDWTGSMYGYGAQVLDWHLKNFEKSEIISMTLFNDGDSKSQHEKKPGETGGIYFEPADNVPQLVDLFNYVKLQGGGGDSPENNVEAILKAMDEYPKFSEIVMIADNNACVRDIQLADRIKIPVRIVLCGYDEKKGVNPHYVYLAKITGGGVYTIEEDLENIDVELKEGDLANFKDKRFKLIKGGCSDIEYLMNASRTYTLDEALKNKKDVVRLDASNRGLEKIPRGIYKMDRLSILDLSKNKLTEISPKVGTITFLKSLDLSSNQLRDLPFEIAYIFYLETLDLSANKLDSIPKALYSMKHLRSLDLSDNNIQTFDIASMAKLHTLDLSGNGLSQISKPASKLKQMRILDLSDNSLTAVPPAVGSMRKVRDLNLSNNQISNMPDDLRRFINLKQLNLSGNPISETEKDRIRAVLKFTQITF